MRVTGIAPQLRTADLGRAIRFYVETLGFELGFRYQDFYAGIRAGGQMLHLKRVDDPDPSIAFVRDGDHLRELALRDPDGHTLYFGQAATMRR